LTLKRRGKIDSAHCTRARSALERLNPVIDDEGQRRALGAVWQLADEHAFRCTTLLTWSLLNGKDSGWRRVTRV
jgi:hypothetical protein